MTLKKSLPSDHFIQTQVSGYWNNVAISIIYYFNCYSISEFIDIWKSHFRIYWHLKSHFFLVTISKTQVNVTISKTQVNGYCNNAAIMTLLPWRMETETYVWQIHQKTTSSLEVRQIVHFALRPQVHWKIKFMAQIFVWGL